MIFIFLSASQTILKLTLWCHHKWKSAYPVLGWSVTHLCEHSDFGSHKWKASNKQDTWWSERGPDTRPTGTDRSEVMMIPFWSHRASRWVAPETPRGSSLWSTRWPLPWSPSQSTSRRRWSASSRTPPHLWTGELPPYSPWALKKGSRYLQFHNISFFTLKHVVLKQHVETCFKVEDILYRVFTGSSTMHPHS